MTMNISIYILLYCILPFASAQLQVGFYNNKCPRAETIVREVVETRFKADRTIPAALLRMNFHDCFVKGCDASILIDSTNGQGTQKNVGANKSVRGYELIDEIKAKLEAACPDTVSCADIISLATRDSVVLAGGPTYIVSTGRRDGLDSNVNDVNLIGPRVSTQQALAFFKTKNLDLNDMVALLGAHTIGITHCSFIQDRLFNFQGTGKPDTSLDPSLLATLINTCRASTPNNDPSIFLDQNTSFILDNQYYNDLMKKKGILQLDQNLASDPSSAPIVATFANNENLFRENFAKAMIKMNNVEVLVGNSGEIRKNCRVANQRQITPLQPGEPIPPRQARVTRFSSMINSMFNRNRGP